MDYNPRFCSPIPSSASAQTGKRIAKDLNTIFPKGQLGPVENFTGKAWNKYWFSC
jgi:hypothetical protein